LTRDFNLGDVRKIVEAFKGDDCVLEAVVENFFKNPK
jgi:hypothetical protein